MPAITAATLDIGANGQWKGTQGTITADKPVFSSTATWNASGVTFTHLKANITDTASAAGSMLIDLQVGGVSQFKVTKGGAGTFAGPLVATTLTLSSTLAVTGAVGIENGQLNLSPGGSANGAINANASMFFNIDSDNNATGELFGWSHNGSGVGGTRLMTLMDTGQVLIGTTVTNGSAAGDLVLANAKAVLGVSGATAYPLLAMSSGDRVQLGGGYASAFGIVQIRGLAAASLPPSAASENGSIILDTTNNRFCFYVGGNRYYATATSF